MLVRISVSVDDANPNAAPPAITVRLKEPGRTPAQASRYWNRSCARLGHKRKTQLRRSHDRWQFDLSTQWGDQHNPASIHELTSSQRNDVRKAERYELQLPNNIEHSFLVLY
jgi:hypothetical protein